MENEIMSAYTVVFDGLDYLGPGDSTTSINVLERLRPNLPAEPRIADFGCGVGASTLVLAKYLPNAHVLALDSHAPFIGQLETTANESGLGKRISAVVGDMAEPPPLLGVEGKFDLIWSESSIYSIGRLKAYSLWRPLLNPGGWLVFSDIVWQCELAARSDKASKFWAGEYPDMTTADVIVDELIAAGFNPLEPVSSGRKSWSNYYEPIRERLPLLKKRRDRSRALIEVMSEFEREIEVFDCCGDEVALAFFLAGRD